LSEEAFGRNRQREARNEDPKGSPHPQTIVAPIMSVY
jgi:hypothetical protein